MLSTWNDWFLYRDGYIEIYCFIRESMKTLEHLFAPTTCHKFFQHFGHHSYFPEEVEETYIYNSEILFSAREVWRDSQREWEHYCISHDSWKWWMWRTQRSVGFFAFIDKNEKKEQKRWLWPRLKFIHWMFGVSVEEIVPSCPPMKKAYYTFIRHVKGSFSISYQSHWIFSEKDGVSWCIPWEESILLGRLIMRFVQP